MRTFFIVLLFFPAKVNNILQTPSFFWQKINKCTDLLLPSYYFKKTLNMLLTTARFLMLQCYKGSELPRCRLFNLQIKHNDDEKEAILWGSSVNGSYGLFAAVMQ